ncbi:MarR family winged helix-turn-helix transcriptional regulator [Lactococcus nasutitermitis]|uniref:MarR family winged helix-turn-helix transcriptional regulator n=1 Tax=Lactococcus nasutitermitis TaxID=1652957 RepID=A0ABV9JAZ8_9LACT|nr:MarR family winged helix-turn-helix transcriptional regulator [Lactococcus nasutitermitis]
MSEQTNNLLHLFSKLLRNPNVMLAMRADAINQQMRNRNARNGAQGLLVELWEKDGLTNAEIAELLDIKPSSVTAQVKNLEESGLVERIADENDKRVNRVFLTEKGREAQKTRSQLHDDMSETIFDSLTEEEQKQLAELLTKLSKANEVSNNEDLLKKFFGDDNIWKLMNAHDQHIFGNQFRREMQDYRREMNRMGQQMKRGANAARRGARDEMPFGEDWKTLMGNLKDSFKANFKDGTDNQNFDEHWNNFMNNFRDSRNDSRGFGGGRRGAYFNQKRDDFKSQPFFNNDDPSSKNDKTEKDNWDEF